MGWETVAVCEIDKFCQETLKYHFPKATIHGDIKTTDFRVYRGKIDIITGGFPCQPYSVAGKRKGKEDERHLWPEMLRAIREVQPTWVAGENVAGLVNWSGGLVFDEVQTDLEAEGYEVIPFILPACGVNAPHKRERIWFVAYSESARRRKLQNKSVEEGTRHCNELSGSKHSIQSNEWSLADTSSGRQSGKEHGEKKPGFITKTSIPDNWENFPTQSPVCSGNDGIPDLLDGITFSKWRNESIKAYGNAIVPQVALQIYKAIDLFVKQV